MKFGLAMVLGVLIFSAGIHGDLGSILAALIDPGALSEVTGSNAPPPQAVSVPNSPSKVAVPDKNGNCPSGFINVAGYCIKPGQIIF